MGKYFGTDGFRGEANETLTAEQAYRVGRYLGWFFAQDRDGCRALLGKDTRRSSDMLEHALIAGLTASGAEVFLLQVTTTPSVSHLVRTGDFDFGIMISASHNPFYDNGIKLVNGNGEKLDESVTDGIEAYLDGRREELPFAKREKIGVVRDYADGRKQYLDYLKSLAGRCYAGLRIGLDCANGSTSELAGRLFSALGAEVEVIHHEPDGLNVNRGCGSTHIESLQQLVREKQLDAGFAFDGDADRCLAVDEGGEVINGDQILYICGCYMKEKGLLDTNTIVTTVMSNLGLYRALDAAGIAYEKTKVGDRFVHESMLEKGHRLGGEQSGHIIFSRYASTGDGMLTAIQLLEVLREKKLPLSFLAAPVQIYPQLLQNVRVRSKEEARADERVQEAVKQVTEALGEEGRILVRESGTEPLLRVMVEARSEELCRKYVTQVVEVIRAQGHEV